MGYKRQKASQVAILKNFGISLSQSSRWQALAAIPEEDFEAALADEEKPSTNGIIAKPSAYQPARPTDTTRAPASSTVRGRVVVGEGSPKRGRAREGDITTAIALHS